MEINEGNYPEIKINQSLFFANPLWTFNVNDRINNSDLIDYAYDIYDQTEGIQKSNRLGFHSTYLNVKKDEVDERFEPLVSEIFSFSRSLFSEQLFTATEDKSFEIESWVNINPKYSYNAQHIHGGDCLISLVYYAQVPNNSGNFYLIDDNIKSDIIRKFNIDKFKPLLPRLSILPKHGDIFAFPSWVNHGVEQNLSDEDRISFAFNIKCNINKPIENYQSNYAY